jgi:hypothetical protein
MVLRAMDVFVLPHLARTIEVVNRRRIRVARVELTDWIVTHLDRSISSSRKKAQKAQKESAIISASFLCFLCLFAATELFPFGK